HNPPLPKIFHAASVGDVCTRAVQGRRSAAARPRARYWMIYSFRSRHQQWIPKLRLVLLAVTALSTGGTAAQSATSSSGRNLYIDHQIGSSSCTTYDPVARSCAGGTETAYKTIAGGFCTPGTRSRDRIVGRT